MVRIDKEGWAPSKQGLDKTHGKQEQNQESGDVGPFVSASQWVLTFR